MNYVLGCTDAFDAMIYPQQHSNTTNFLRTQVSNLSNSLTDAGRMFMERSKQAFEFFNSNAAIDFARRVVASVKKPIQTDHVTRLWEPEALQQASLTMQRWIMANPTVREYYHAQKIDGYSDTYSDIHGKVSGEDHYDYRRVMDGMCIIEEDDFYFTEYVEPLIEGDRDLTFGEKVDIIHTWSALESLLALAEDDPTNPTGGTM